MANVSTSTSESFAALFEESLARQDMRSGEVITAEVVSIDSDFVVVNAGLKSESVIDASEFLNDHGDMEVKVGDLVMYGKYSGTEISHEGHNYLIMNQSDILAVL